MVEIRTVSGNQGMFCIQRGFGTVDETEWWSDDFDSDLTIPPTARALTVSYGINGVNVERTGSKYV